MPTKERARRLRLLKHAGGRFASPEPKGAPLDDAIPDELTDAVARAEWQRLVETLTPGHARAVERPCWLAYCQKYGEWVTTQRAADAEPFTITSAHGGVIAHPLHAMADRAFQHFLAAAVQCGLTPLSRARVVRVPRDHDPSDAFTKYQKQRDRS